MAKYEFLQPRFTEGVLAKSLQGRSSEEFYSYGYKSSQNMIPVLSGPVVKRPGTNFIGEAKDPSAVLIPFFKDKDNTYILEIGVYAETISSNITSGDATVTVTSTSTFSVGQPVTGSGIPDNTTILSITNSTTFELTANATASTTGVALSITVGYLRVWSQSQLLYQRTGTPGTTSTSTIYESASAIPWTEAKLSTIKSTQSGDIIFVCCPTLKPYKISRTLVTSGTRAGDDSSWAVEEYVMLDGPYKAVNYWDETDDTKKYSLEIADPGGGIKIGAVEFNTVDDSLVLANHGLQIGEKIKLDGNSGTGWGNVRQTATTGDSTTQTKMNGTATSGTTDNFILEGWVVSSTGTSFQFADADLDTVRKFELVTDDPTTTTSNANVILYKYAYEAGSTGVEATLYVNNGSGSQAATKTYFSDTDIGRSIRINPLMIAGNPRGGIKWGWAVITAVDNSGTNGKITLDIKSELTPTRGTYGTSEFRLGAYSDGEGWPHVAQIYQQRMVLAANTNQPSTIWLSETANFYSFAPTVLTEQGSITSQTDGVASEVVVDTNALTFTLDSDTLDSIKWLAESKRLTMGTSAGVYMLYGSETNLVVTPFRFTINRETSFSATDTVPVVVSNAVLYAQIGGKDVQSLELESSTGNQWLASKISMKGYDIIKTSSIKKMVWQERPNNIIWIAMEDGKLLSLSYDRGTNFQAWSEHVIGGSIYRNITATLQSSAEVAFTASESSGLLLTSANHQLSNGDIVQVTTTGSLPTGLSLSTNYYVVNKTDDTFKLALTSVASAIAYTDSGSGTHSWAKPTIYTVAGDQTTMYTVDKNVVVSGYSITNWNSTQKVLNVLSTGGNTEITTDLDSSGLANSTQAVSGVSPRISDENTAHAQVIDIEMIPTATHDQIWFKIKRTINGTDKYYIETLGRFPTEGALARNEYVFSDSAITGSVGVDKIVSGLAHLVNEEVQIYYEGMQHTNQRVATNQVVLSHTQGNEHVTGLPYTAQLETLDPPSPVNQFSYTKRLIKIAVLIEESLGIQLDYNDLSEELLFRTTVDLLGRQISLFSGMRKLSLSGIGWETHNLIIRSNGPFPMQLNAIIIEAETGGS